MLELLFLLLPVAAGYGWYMGKNSNRHNELHQKATLSKQYSEGLNFLLSNQEEKAVEHLIEFLEMNADTLETHLALANLFRKRGEFDKALEIHDRLNGLNLDQQCSDKIKMELGKDYISAGMLDRAEDTLLAIPATGEHHMLVVQMLVNIYQTMKDWQKSDDLCGQLDQLTPQLKCTLAHHCCELARESLDSQTQLSLYRKALQYDPLCVRALMAIADLSFKAKAYQQALLEYQQVIEVDWAYTVMVLDKIEQCFTALDNSSGFFSYLRQQSASNACVSFASKYSAYIEQYEGADKALAFILTILTKKPTIRAFVTLLELESKNTDSVKASVQFEEVKKLVKNYLQSKPLYECRSCGFASKHHYWLCPSCHNWGQSKPAIGLDGL